MSDFTVHRQETAPEGSRSMLEQAEKKFGFVPNLLGILAEAPAALKAYLTVAESFGSASLDATEQQVVLMTASFENQCTYCMAAHSLIARGQGVDEDVIRALRDGTPIPDAKLEALRRFVRVLVERRGWAGDEDVAAFLDAGYSRAQVLEVITGIAQKTISNYANHVTHTPLDEAFRDAEWTPPKASATQ